MTLLELRKIIGKREFKRFLAMVLHAEGRTLPLEKRQAQYDYGVWEVYCGGATYDFSNCRKDKGKFAGNIHVYKNGSVKYVDINGGALK